MQITELLKKLNGALDATENVENEHFINAIQSIAHNYGFKNLHDLRILLQGLANEKNIGVTYWDYIEVETLISLQKPKTQYPDEIIFITYHQICELYFKLIIQEIQLIQKEALNIPNWLKRVDRINNYFSILVNSFNVLSTKGLDSDEFNEFRKDLLPASGFQTSQFRKIEIMLTDIRHLILDKEAISHSATIKDWYQFIYWKMGALDQKTKTKTKLLTNFEYQYDDKFLELAENQHSKNLFKLFTVLKEHQNGQMVDMIHLKLIKLDHLIYEWKLKHFETIGEHFIKFRTAKGTGGTNAHEFLTLSMKQIKYFPIANT
jgi:tryptophan 2,3-dioxygenase